MDEAQVKALIDAATKPLLDQLGQVAEANKKIGELEANQKVVADTLQAQKLLSAADVKALLGTELSARDAAAQVKSAEADAEKQKAAAATDASAALKAKRDVFAAEKLKGVPAKYHALGDDESKWAEEEKAIREGFAADLQAAGIKVADVGGSAGGSAVAGGAAGVMPTGSLPAGLAAFAGK